MDPPDLPVAVVAAVERRGDSSLPRCNWHRWPMPTRRVTRAGVLQPLDRAQAARKEADAPLRQTGVRHRSRQGRQTVCQEG